MNSDSDIEIKYSKDSVPWPSIIMLIFGGIIVLFTIAGPNIPSDIKILGVMLVVLWSLLWTLILWLLWIQYTEAISWWLSILPIIIIILFFVLIILLN